MLKKIAQVIPFLSIVLPSAVAQQWAHTWGGTSDESFSSVATDSSGNAYFAGSTSSFGAGGVDVLLTKYNSAGQLVWSRTWGGSGSEGGNGVGVDTSGNVYVTGATSSFGAGWYDVFLVKFDGSGTLLWSRTWGGSSYDAGYDLAFDAGGNVYVAAESYSLGNRAVLLKFDPSGNLLATSAWKGPATYDSGYSVDVDKSGNVVLAGVSWDYSVYPNHNSILILKFDSLGNFLWNRNLVSGAEDQAQGSKVARFDAAGNIFIAGERAAICQSSNFAACNFDAELVKLDTNGTLLWAQAWGGPGFESVGGLAFDQAGNLVATGTTNSFLGGTSAAMLLRFASSGNLLDSRIWGGNGSVSGAGAAVDGSGAILLAGSSPNASGSWQSVTASAASISPTLSVPSGNIGIYSLSVGMPPGTVTMPTGVIDVGGGGTDALAIRTTPSTGCSVNVTKLYQAVDGSDTVQLPWACEVYNDPYGDQRSRYCPSGPQEYRIAQVGCALTALTMSLNTAGLSFDPGTLNSFMLPRPPQHPSGDFGTAHGVLFDTTVADVASAYNRSLAWVAVPSSMSTQQLQNTLCTEAVPIIVGVDSTPNQLGQPVPGHYVLVTGWDGAQFQIADPGYPAKTTLLAYGNQFLGAGYVKDPQGDRSSLHVSVGDAELLVTDPNGLTSGFDVTAFQNLNQIPGSAYSSEGLINDETGAPPAQIDYVLDIHQPATGTYTVDVQGLKLETYSLSIRAFDVSGNPEPALSVIGIMSPTSTQTLDIQYVSSTGATSTVTILATFQSTLADIQNSLQLGLIDNPGIANSLSQKIQAAQGATAPARNNVLSAFINEVNAQSGKHITGMAPQVLLQDAASLLQQN